MKNKRKVTQQELFCKGLLIGAKSEDQQQNKPIMINVKDQRIRIEVYPNCKGFLVYKTIVNGLDQLWQDWTTDEDIEKTFDQLLNA